MKKNILFVGIDVDDKAYNVCIYNPLSDEIDQYKCGPSPDLLVRSFKKRKLDVNSVRVCYEASYIGYSLQRKIQEKGYNCKITAPSLIPKQPGAKQKTDKIDSIKLAKYYSKDLLTFIYIPDEEDESVRDLLRSRQFLVAQRTKIKNHILSMCRRLGWNYKLETGAKSHWTEKHQKWLSSKIKTLKNKVKIISFRILLKQFQDTSQNIDLTDTEIEHISQNPRYKKKVETLVCFKGVKEKTALTLITELGDIRRFDHPKRITSYAGFDIIEYSSGGKENKFGISKHGNSFLRKAAVDAVKFAVRKPDVSREVRKRRENLSPEFAEIVSKCENRLFKKGTRMVFAGKPPKKVQVACAREFLGFVWDVLHKTA